MERITPKTALTVEITASSAFADWLSLQQISLAFTTYQSSRLMLLGVTHEGQLSGFERFFDRAMGLFSTPERIYLASKYQLWQLDNVLAIGQIYEDYDKLYIPRIGYTTGDLGIHDIGIEESRANRIVFISSLLNCLATVSDRHSCLPLWKPPFISRLANEDRCHLNGLAIVDGKARYVTACSRSDMLAGWQDHRENGGCIIDIESNEIIGIDLSMPHSPRFYRGKLWLLNAGTGEFGYIRLQTGAFEPVAFCPGFLRGLAFIQNYAIVGLSKPRESDSTFSGLKLNDTLIAQRAEPFCGLMVIDLHTGNVVHWLRLDGEVTELYDVQVLLNTQRPMALGFQRDEISRLITIEPMQKGSSLFFAPTFQNHQAPIISVNTAAQSFFDHSRLLKQQKDLEASEKSLREAIQLQPDFWGAHNNLGTLLQGKGLLNEAEQCYERAIKYNPYFAEAVGNRASIWQLHGELERAKPELLRSIQIKPDYFPAHINLASIYKQQGRLEEAINHYRIAIALSPDQIDAHFQLGQILEYLEKVEEALIHYEKVLEIDPSITGIEVFISFARLQLCDWDNYDQRTQSLIETVTASIQGNSFYIPNPWMLSYFPVSLELHQKLAVHHAQLTTKSVESVKTFLVNARLKDLDKKLRVGYISPDFRDHAVGRLIHQLFQHHDRNCFEIYAYSTTDAYDFITNEIKRGCDQFINVSSLTSKAAAQRIYDDGIDILIDLAGYTIGNGASILALKPAPIQIQFLGYPDTLGAEFVQYVIADEWLITSEIADYYTERILYLPHAFVSSLLDKTSNMMTRKEFGLPQGFIFTCFNNHRKISPDAFDAWMEILRQVPDSSLWLMAGTNQTCTNLRWEAKIRGINKNRLIFSPRLPHSEYLARYQFADLFLDTFSYSAGSTAIAALSEGVPVLTRPGFTNASRMGASICAAAQLTNFICPTTDVYIEKAIYLATHSEELAQVRQFLQTHRSVLPLFDIARFTQNLESTFKEVYQESQKT